MLLAQLLFIFPLTFIRAQLYYPNEETGGYSLNFKYGDPKAAAGKSSLPSTDFATRLPPGVNLTEIRGTQQYEDFVDKIIADGICKLTLATNKALLSSSSTKLQNDNIVFAPVGIAGALALILLGSNGKTFNEISTVMGLATGVEVHNRSHRVHEQFGRIIRKLEVTSGFDLTKQVHFATGIFVQDGYPIREEYKQSAKAIYESEVINVNFKNDAAYSQQTINSWVSQKTNGKIDRILTDSPSSDTRVILASALYFMAEWDKPFFDGGTKKRPFFHNGRKSQEHILVELMANGGFFPYYKDTQLDCEIMGFPYKGNQTTMYVVMPHDSNRDKLKQLHSQLTSAHINRLLDNVRYTDVITLFPKMKLESTVDLRRTLQMLGVTSLFSPVDANLALLSPGYGALPQIAPKYDTSSPVTVAPSPNHYRPKDNEEVLIFSRGREINCTQLFNTTSEIQACAEKTQKGSSRKVRAAADPASAPKTLDNIRDSINRQSNAERFENPGLYADSVIHKVFMDITESGTEAAAATAASLSRDGGRVTFRVDVPFIFFVLHEQTRTPLFWGSVNTPTPSFTSE